MRRTRRDPLHPGWQMVSLSYHLFKTNSTGKSIPHQWHTRPSFYQPKITGELFISYYYTVSSTTSIPSPKQKYESHPCPNLLRSLTQNRTVQVRSQFTLYPHNPTTRSLTPWLSPNQWLQTQPLLARTGSTSPLASAQLRRPTYRRLRDHFRPEAKLKCS